MFAKSVKLAVATTLAMSFGFVQASSLAPTTKSTTSSLQTINSLSPNEKGFAYPVPNITSQDLTETGVLFVYNDHILNFFNNDPERLVEYVNSAISYNNRAFSNSNIPVKRVVSGLVFADGEELPFWESDASYTERLDGLTALQSSAAGMTLASDTQYSYLVGLAGFEALANEDPIVGLSFLSGNVSWISPYTNNSETWSERTLAHELGHNDGFRHSNQDHNEHLDYLAREDATGFKCGNYASVMNVAGDRTEPFFSDTHITLHEHDHEVTCGVANEANAAQVYRDLALNNIANSEGTFSNLMPTRENTGFVSIYANAGTVIEGQNLSFDVIFEGGERADSVNVLVRQGSASLDDYDSTILHITHNGIDNVYTVNVATNNDSVSESTETLTVELIFPNGVALIENSQIAQGSIIDDGGQDTQNQLANTITANNTSQQGVGSSLATTPSVAGNVVATSPAVNSTSSTNLNASTSEAGGGGSLGMYSALLLLAVVVRRAQKCLVK